MIKIVIFDLDGTLADTMDGLAYSGNFIAKKYGLKLRDRAFYERAIGNGAKAFIRCLAKDQNTSEKKLDEMSDAFLVNYNGNWNVGLRVYDGMKKVVSALKRQDIVVAINTNKPQTMTDKVVPYLFEENTFFDVKGACDAYNKKPDPQGVKLILDKAEMKPSECIYIGDSIVDINTAKNAGVKSIGVPWGYGKNSDIKNATYFAKKADQILEIIAALNG